VVNDKFLPTPYLGVLCHCDGVNERILIHLSNLTIKKSEKGTSSRPTFFSLINDLKSSDFKRIKN